MSFVFFQNLSVIFFTDTSGNSSQCGIFCEGLKCSLAVVGGQQRCVSDSGGVTVTDIKICPPCDSVLLTHSLMCLLLNLQNTVKQKDTDGGVMSNSCVETLKQFSLVSTFSLSPQFSCQQCLRKLYLLLKGSGTGTNHSSTYVC